MTVLRLWEAEALRQLRARIARVHGAFPLPGRWRVKVHIKKGKEAGWREGEKKTCFKTKMPGRKKRVKQRTNSRTNWQETSLPEAEKMRTTVGFYGVQVGALCCALAFVLLALATHTTLQTRSHLPSTSSPPLTIPTAPPVIKMGEILKESVLEKSAK